MPPFTGKLQPKGNTIMRTLAAIAFALLVTGPVAADTMSDMVMAREIGQIVGTADLCGYDLDADKVAAFVSEQLAAMAPTSRAAFQSGSGAQKIRMKEMSELERKVTCATQAKVAVKYGLAP
ncbi:hypothetical protein SAMN05877838_3508 [Hoeflea halophila]|uniref:HdeA/HdeB family protein n=1 Tax=Hoeflea halophila TaxID=714899 RepID=A0A286IGU1_9HYPH|nr:hypothetical protein [Hoeflea halophila]SOE18579.1 hypothetical protein SAMN05877838_3508 [Hoeflea halophila]